MAVDRRLGRGARRARRPPDRLACGVDLLFADEPRWRRLEGIDGYLGRAASVPAVEHYGPASELGALTTDEVVELASDAHLVGAQQRPDQLERTWR